MVPFLKAVARGYASHYAGLQGRAAADLSDFCFVFPNKRAGTFFLKYLREEADEFVLAPEVTTISDFVENLSGVLIDSRLDLLFLLYRTYCEIAAPGVSPDKLPESLGFENFRMWGETILSDFNDVDMQDVNADEIFRNLRDFREIATDFLTDEQKEVIEEYFGRKPYDGGTRFWKEFPEDPAPGTLPGQEGIDARPMERFVHLWQILRPLYRRFNEKLDEEGLTTTGGAYRKALRRLEEEGDALLPYRKIVMVGFNALSHSERGIFRQLKRLRSPEIPGEPLTDFLWDATGPILTDRDNAAGRFVLSNRRRFPSPEWFAPFRRESDTYALPQYLEVISSPSNSVQTKIGAMELERLAAGLAETDNTALEDARVALVLPDEGLLLPLLYSLPDSLGEPNLTMGYPLKMTSVATFMTLVRNMQMTQRGRKGSRGFAVDELNRLLAHPISHAILGTQKINEFRGKLREKHLIIATQSDIAGISEYASRLLRPIDMNAPADVVIAYLDDVLRLIEEAMALRHTDMLRGRLEYTHASTWRDALSRMADTIRRRNVNPSAASVFLEADRLLSAETVPFEGEPLQGLQVMGLLETRLLDFDHIVILSMNDKILPMKARKRTFIPDSIRMGFAMPPASYQESIFAYYFFRLISRAKSVRMVYDSRVGISGGGPSRYIRQLEFLYARENLLHSERKLSVTGDTAVLNPTAKSGHALRKLRDYVAGEGKSRFSASSLKKYCGCQLRFFIEVLAGIKTDMKPTPNLSQITYGDIYHAVMSGLYLPDSGMVGKYLGDNPVVIDKRKIDALTADDRLIGDMIRREVNRQYYHLPEDELDTELPPSTLIIANRMKSSVKDTLRHDRELAPFELLGCEVRGETVYDRVEGLPLNMTFAIDRIDRVADSTGERRLRIVDYKTGSSYSAAENLEDIFRRMGNSDPTFQLMLYAELLRKWLGENGHGNDIDPEMVVYDVRNIDRAPEKQIPQFLESDDVRFSAVRTEFLSRLDEMIREIFDPGKQFSPAENTDNCTMCDFAEICRQRM